MFVQFIRTLIIHTTMAGAE